MALHRAGQAPAERVRGKVGYASLRVNGRLRDECLNEHLFCSLVEARTLIEAWRVDYNTCRPHTSLGGLAPAIYAQQTRKHRHGSPELRMGSAHRALKPEHKQERKANRLS